MIALICVLIGLIAQVGMARAEDFSVHLGEVGEIDGGRAVPAYTLERLHEEKDNRGDMPLKTFDVFMRFKKFGDLYLDNAFEEGPATGKEYAKGMTFSGGLDDLSEVKAGWIKDSPDLLIVGWEIGHGRGNNPTPDQALAIVQLKDGRAKMLLRLVDPCGIRAAQEAEGEATESRRFSWDAKAAMLVERIGSSRMIRRKEKGPLVREGTPFEEDLKGFWVQLDEEITVTYQIAQGKLVACRGTLVYKAPEKVDLAEVAGFYLTGDSRAGEPKVKRFKEKGAAVKALLETNPELAEKFKGLKSGDGMVVEKGAEVRVPVEEKELVGRYGFAEAVEGQGQNAKSENRNPK